jgi:AraC-like DNA-binding protein
MLDKRKNWIYTGYIYCFSTWLYQDFYLDYCEFHRFCTTKAVIVIFQLKLELTYTAKDVIRILHNLLFRQPDKFGLSFNCCENFSVLQSGFNQIILIQSGCAILNFNSKNFFIQSGTMIMRSPNTEFKVVYSYKLSALSITFKPEYIYTNSAESNPVRDAALYDLFCHLPYLNFNDTRILPIYPINRFKSNRLFISAITDMINRKDRYWHIRVVNRLREIFNLCFNLSNHTEDHVYAQLTKKTLEYIHSNYNREITVSMLCKLLHTNHTSLLQAFRKFTGTTIGQYILEFRLNLVSNALIFTNLTIEEIAEEYGFRHASYLSRVFRSRIGLAPGRFRNYICSKSNANKQDIIA